MLDSVRHIPAWDALADLPASLAEMSLADRGNLVVSAVILADGTKEVVSRFGDDTWRLDAYIDGPGVSDAEKFIEWPDDCPRAMVDDLKAACFAWKQRGRNECAPPQWQTVRVTAVLGVTFTRWLTTHGIDRFDAIKPIHVSSYLHHCRNELQLVPGGVRHRIGIIDLLWRFRADLLYPLTFAPFEGRSVSAVSGAGRLGFETASTPIIPRPVQEQIYNYCIGVLERAEELAPYPPEVDPRQLSSPQFLEVRNVGLYLIAITTGVRNDELLGVEIGAYREETLNGVTYRWLKTVEHKTGKGEVEYLCPAITGRVVRQLELWVRPFHALLRSEINELERQPASADRDLRLQKARADSKRLFLAVAPRNGWQVASMSSEASREAMQRVARAAGTDWRLNPHQTRRTYARMIVESKMGRASLIFLKWQLKHSTMTMTQGYASNPLADRSLFEDFFDEMVVFKSELIDLWTSETPLSGGAGRSIVELRATPHANREALLKSASEHVHIRGTGHGWCLAEARGCGGAGLYEATRCVNCKDGVIDPTFADVWVGIHEQQRELLDLSDVGPAVRARAAKEVRLSSAVLNDLGLVEGAE